MEPSQEPDPTLEEKPPGKTRTWWHPLLVRLLEWMFRDSCDVQNEVNVGRMPLRLDVLLIRRLGTEIPKLAHRDLRSITKRLNRYTLIEFKSPVDHLHEGDWNKLLGCAHLYVAQQPTTIRHTEITLIVLAPRLTDGFRDEVALSGHRIIEQENGIHQIEGHTFSAYVLESDVIVGLEEPILTLFSRIFLNHREDLARQLCIDHPEVLFFFMQQVIQFRSQGSDFQMAHTFEHMDRSFEEVQKMVLEWLPHDELLKYLTTEERLKGLPPEERLKGLPPEERLKGLTEEELARLRQLLDQSKPSE